MMKTHNAVAYLNTFSLVLNTFLIAYYNSVVLKRFRFHMAKNKIIVTTTKETKFPVKKEKIKLRLCVIK